MRKIAFVFLLLGAVNVYSRQDTLKYRISLKDKAATAYSLENPGRFLSGKSIARRERQGLPVDSTDLPVCDSYVKAIRDKGVNIIVTGKWENFVTVSCNDTTLITEIAGLPFVRSVEQVWKARMPLKKQPPAKRDTVTNKTVELEEWYGAAHQQIKLSNGDKLHEAGYRGEGMTIAVMDAGFHNADRIEALRNVRISGTKDFVGNSKSIYMESYHGLQVLSCMAMNKPYVMVGTAPEAEYWLFRTEDERSEHLVEQDYWAAAVEFADSVGADLVNTSLGYYSYDDKKKNLRYRDLDGKYSLISRQASRLADKGMVLLCSAGNTGQGSWKKITAPADAENILTVGAVSKNAQLAPFSSVGNTADNRIKPDVMAVGMFTNVLASNGEVTIANGTSFATPVLCGMVACLWQACPELTAKQLVELVRSSGSQSDSPDNILGYGIPDLWKAYQTAKGSATPP